MFRQKCFPCHGNDPGDVRGSLDMRTRAGLLRGGDSEQPAMAIHQPRQSPLYLAVTRSSDDWSAMPPKESDRVAPELVEKLAAWIQAGAPWPDATRLAELEAQAERMRAGVRIKTSGGLNQEWSDRRYQEADLWAYQPLRNSSDRPTETHPVDYWIGQALQQAGLAPAPRATREQWIRRATFDLLGLAPTRQEIADFVNDPAEDGPAARKVVDRLLNSPHYGEQWARHWLDITRYADSSGYANDYERGNAWRYRDYVIRSFNNDKPYDQFVLEQLAGDEIHELPEAAQDPRLHAIREAGEGVIAAGFLRMGPWELTGMEVAKVARQRFLDDVTDSVGQVFLGHMLQCARCHDHKFDPVPTRDYYSIQAVFATTQLAERQLPFLAVEQRRGFDEQRYLRQRGQHYEEMLGELEERSIQAARQWLQERQQDPALFEAALRQATQAGGKRRGNRFQSARNIMRRNGAAEAEIPPRHAGFEPVHFGLERVARKGLERLRWRLERYQPYALSVYSGRTPNYTSVYAPLRVPKNRWNEGELEKTSILAGGDPFSPVAPVQPGVLSACKPAMEVDRAVSAMRPARSAQYVSAETLNVWDAAETRRLKLALWIVDPRNPLTARVIVNRLWQWHFGKPIAGNPNNFGATGKKPTHPELLDELAAELIRHNWSLKHLHRLIMSSEAYCRSTQHPDAESLRSLDSTRELYAVFLPRRLDAEEIRDATLQATGELNLALGGAPIRPEMNREAALQPRMVMGTFAEAWQPSQLPSQRHRRTLYALRIRGQRDPFLEVFNAPAAELSCEARESSTVTPQVFALFNSEISYDRALAMARRIFQQAHSARERVELAFELAYGRVAEPAELEACLKHWERMTENHRHMTFPKPQYPLEVTRQAVEENTGERFEFVEPLEVYRDFVPDFKPYQASAEMRGLAEVCLVLLNSSEFLYVY